MHGVIDEQVQIMDEDERLLAEAYARIAELERRGGEGTGGSLILNESFGLNRLLRTKI